MATIVIKISPTGEVQIDAQGFSGNACSLATKSIEQVLVGSGKVHDSKKPEFFLPPVQDTNLIKFN